MKEASGELSMTAVAVVAIGAIAVLFGTFIFPNIKASLERNQLCTTAFGCDCGSNGKTCKCSAYKKNETTTTDVFCDNPNYTAGGGAAGGGAAGGGAAGGGAPGMVIFGR